MRIGYARVSTQDQNMDLQHDALTQSGCSKIFVDKISGVATERKGLQEALAYARPGDTLVVWKLDRLGRTLKNLIHFINELHTKNINFISLQESIDTTSPSGKLVFHLFASLAEFERDMIIERTKAGLSAARARGRVGGRRKKLTPEKLKQVKALYDSKTVPVKEICSTFSIAKPTLYKYLKKEHSS